MTGPTSGMEMELVGACPVEGCAWVDDPPGENVPDIQVRGWSLHNVNPVTAHLVIAHRDLVNDHRPEARSLFNVDLWARFVPRAAR